MSAFLLSLSIITLCNQCIGNLSLQIAGQKQDCVICEKQPMHISVSDRTIFYDSIVSPSTSFIVISKKYTDLSVYAPIDDDTILIARYPVCLSRKLGQKEKNGDMKTPECTMEKPFTITQIQNSSDWHHDFGDGRGSIKAYGKWFLRLSTPPHSGIGIHGSTNNEASVPSRDSEGCIRMRDADIIHLKENYAYKGMKVIVTKEEQDILSFERNVIVKHKNGIPMVIQALENKEIIEKHSEKVIEKTTPIKKEETSFAENVVSSDYHIVKQGNTLYLIAKKYKTSVSKLCEMNNIKENHVLQIGEKIRVRKTPND